MVLVDFAQTCLFVPFRYIISKIIISLTNQLDISRNLHILKTYVPYKVVSREINHSINCMYYRRLFGVKWKNYRVTCSLKYEGLHLLIFATNHCL